MKHDSESDVLSVTEETDGAETQAWEQDSALNADHNEIALLAYSYWQERGCPDGEAEDDWFRARRELTSLRAGK